MVADIFGQVLQDFYQGQYKSPLLLHNNYGAPEEMPIEVFFREERELSDLEQFALDLCAGKVLDVGAGAGAHSLVLQRNFDVMAIEASPGACRVMKDRGVKNIINENVFNFHPENKFDTLLILMNGTGIAGTYNNFIDALVSLKPLLAPEGKIIIDSSDISYLYYEGFPSDHYFGEVFYQYEYKGQKGEWFPWLYLDQRKLKKLSMDAGFHTQVVYEGVDDDFLAVLEVI